jgi:hypothetical protein
MKTCPVGALLCQTDGGLTDMMKLMIDFAFANSPNELKNKKLTLHVFVLYFTPSIFVTQVYSIPYLPKRKTIQLYSHRVGRQMSYTAEGGMCRKLRRETLEGSNRERLNGMDFLIADKTWPQKPDSVTDETADNRNAVICGNIRDGREF